MAEYTDRVEEYQLIMDEINRYKQINKAMDARLSLKSEEIQVLQTNIRTSKEKLSLQIHTMNEMKKQLLIDPSITSHFDNLRSHLSKLQAEFTNQKTVNQSLTSKHMSRVSKMYDRWHQETEDMYVMLDDYAQGKIQDLHLQIGLTELKNQELKNCLDEYKAIAAELEKEMQSMDLTLRNLEQRHRTSHEPSEKTKQESSKGKR